MPFNWDDKTDVELLAAALQMSNAIPRDYHPLAAPLAPTVSIGMAQARIRKLLSDAEVRRGTMESSGQVSLPIPQQNKRKQLATDDLQDEPEIHSDSAVMDTTQAPKRIRHRSSSVEVPAHGLNHSNVPERRDEQSPEIEALPVEASDVDVAHGRGASNNLEVTSHTARQSPNPPNPLDPWTVGERRDSLELSELRSIPIREDHSAICQSASNNGNSLSVDKSHTTEPGTARGTARAAPLQKNELKFTAATPKPVKGNPATQVRDCHHAAPQRQRQNKIQSEPSSEDPGKEQTDVEDSESEGSDSEDSDSEAADSEDTGSEAADSEDTGSEAADSELSDPSIHPTSGVVVSPLVVRPPDAKKTKDTTRVHAEIPIYPQYIRLVGSGATSMKMTRMSNSDLRRLLRENHLLLRAVKAKSGSIILTTGGKEAVYGTMTLKGEPEQIEDACSLIARALLNPTYAQGLIDKYKKRKSDTRS